MVSSFITIHSGGLTGESIPILLLIACSIQFSFPLNFFSSHLRISHSSVVTAHYGKLGCSTNSSTVSNHHLLILRATSST